MKRKKVNSDAFKQEKKRRHAKKAVKFISRCRLVAYHWQLVQTSFVHNKSESHFRVARLTEDAVDGSDFVLVRVVDETIVLVVSIHVSHPKVLQVDSARGYRGENLPEI